MNKVRGAGRKLSTHWCRIWNEWILLNDKPHRNIISGATRETKGQEKKPAACSSEQAITRSWYIKRNQRSPDTPWRTFPRVTSNNKSQLTAKLTTMHKRSNMFPLFFLPLKCPTCTEEADQRGWSRQSLTLSWFRAALAGTEAGCVRQWEGSVPGACAVRLTLDFGLQVLSPFPAGKHKKTEGMLTLFLSALDFSSVSLPPPSSVSLSHTHSHSGYVWADMPACVDG